jgi:hypothetical protein
VSRPLIVLFHEWQTRLMRTAELLFCSVSACAPRRQPEVQEVVAALARHVCLKAPDRAEPRANAIRAAATMVPLLAQWEQDQFVGFVFHLSRSSKASSGRAVFGTFSPGLCSVVAAAARGGP